MAGGLLCIALSSARVAARALADVSSTLSGSLSSNDWLSLGVPPRAARGEPAGSQGEGGHRMGIGGCIESSPILSGPPPPRHHTLVLRRHRLHPCRRGTGPERGWGRRGRLRRRGRTGAAWALPALHLAWLSRSAHPPRGPSGTP